MPSTIPAADSGAERSTVVAALLGDDVREHRRRDQERREQDHEERGREQAEADLVRRVVVHDADDEHHADQRQRDQQRAQHEEARLGCEREEVAVEDCAHRGR
jgi:hypothetical protein